MRKGKIPDIHSATPRISSAAHMEEAKNIHCLLICDDRHKPNTFPKFVTHLYTGLPCMYSYSSSIKNNSCLFANLPLHTVPKLLFIFAH